MTTYTFVDSDNEDNIQPTNQQTNHQSVKKIRQMAAGVKVKALKCQWFLSNLEEEKNGKRKKKNFSYLFFS